MRESDHSVEWRAQGPGWRRFVRVWLPLTVLFLLATSFVDDLHWATRVSAVANVLVAVSLALTARARTSADPNGVEVTAGLRTRRIPWTAVEELCPERSTGRWPRLIPVEVHLADGSARTLPGVSAADLPRLEELRTTGSTPPTA